MPRYVAIVGYYLSSISIPPEGAIRVMDHEFLKPTSVNAQVPTDEKEKEKHKEGSTFAYLGCERPIVKRPED
jgi:hypothetical protein